MKTRNQIINKVVSECSSNHTTIKDEDNNGHGHAESPTISLPTAPRLRDRRPPPQSDSAESKAPIASSAVPVDQSPSPPVGSKPRSSTTGPTRVLPRRSGRPTSLLAGTQPNSNAVSSSPTVIKPSSPAIEVDKTIDSITSDSAAVEKVTNSTLKPALPEKTFNVLLGVTGSVATIKLVELTHKIKSLFPRRYTDKSNGAASEASIRIKIVMTHNSKHFAPKEELIKNLNDPNIEVLDDSDEWARWKKMGDPVLHIELRKWADLCLIAPLDANTMAKFANGICDNLLTCVVRAWDVSKPLVYCPAMNVHMYNHPMTREQLCKLQSFGYLRVDCVEKRLACGDTGMGGMAPVDSISKKVFDCLIEPVTRKASLTKPLLNQQPTYPIISLAGEQESQTNSSRFPSPISSQILNRFKNNQITIHAVPPKPSFVDELALKRRKKINSDSFEDCFLTNDKPHGKPYSSVCDSLSIDNVKSRTITATSVRNLRAMNNGMLDYDEESKYNVGEERIGYDFDPSKLLEQSMMTGESIANDPMDIPMNINPGQSFARGSSFGGESLARIGGLSPLFNTSKFLASCHNKERGCFTCTICKHDYKNRKSIARHLKEQHVQGNIFQCKPCGVSYKRREKLIKHNKERHPEV